LQGSRQKSYPAHRKVAGMLKTTDKQEAKTIVDLQRQVIAHWRHAIELYTTDRRSSYDYRYLAETLFKSSLLEWPSDFCTLYNLMYKQYCKFTPKPTGHFTTKHIAIGYSSLPMEKWLEDAAQASIPTPKELLIDFDSAVNWYFVEVLHSMF
jgi:hypothetical protein